MPHLLPIENEPIQYPMLQLAGDARQILTNEHCLIAPFRSGIKVTFPRGTVPRPLESIFNAKSAGNYIALQLPSGRIILMRVNDLYKQGQVAGQFYTLVNLDLQL